MQKKPVIKFNIMVRMWGKKEPWYTAGGSAGKCNHSGKEFGGFLKI
jgi:hypothetical protein